MPIIVLIASYRYYKKREVIIENRFLLQYILGCDDMIPPNVLQIPEVLYYGDPLTAEGQVDKVLDRRDALCCRCCLELEGLTSMEKAASLDVKA